jgi:hypothetical protein
LLKFWLGILGFFMRSPEDKAKLALAADIADFIAYVQAYPDLAKIEADIAAFMALQKIAPPAVAPVNANFYQSQNGVHGGPRGGLMAPGS